MQAELEKARRESALAVSERAKLRRRAVLLQHALAASRAAKSGRRPPATDDKQPGRSYQDFLVALVAAVVAALLQGLFGVLFITWSSHVQRFCTWLLGAPPPKPERKRRCRCCRWSWKSLGSLWGIVFILDLGFAVMWHFRIVQPFLCEMVVWVYIFIGCAMVFSLVVSEMWLSLRSKMDEAMEVVDFIHDKTDDMLHLMGHGFHLHRAHKERGDGGASSGSEHESGGEEPFLLPVRMPGWLGGEQDEGGPEEPAEPAEPAPSHWRRHRFFGRKRRLPHLGTNGREIRQSHRFFNFGW